MVKVEIEESEINELVNERASRLVREKAWESRQKPMIQNLQEEDYGGAPITNLSTAQDIVERKNNYGYPGAGDNFAMVEASAFRYPDGKLRRMIIENQFKILQYYSGEGGRAGLDSSVNLSRSASRRTQTLPEVESEKDKEMF